ncbi:MAG: aldo/keto reductase [Candidatus Omnitrophota bacterium]|nr:aldo/keto reductase [Candidatus Omnitrophota bacterium]
MNRELTDRLCLGTAQFGLNYGIANKNGKITRGEVYRILDYAHDSGIRYLDTAFLYGDSENIIGDFISQSGKEFKVISKMPPMNGKSAFAIEEYCVEILSRLKRSEIYGCLVHKFDDVVNNKDLWSKLESLKKKGMFCIIGFSLYKIEELKYLLNNNIRFDIIQVPYNIFDQRFEECLPVLKKMKTGIYSRSVFLQGLFFLETDRIDRDFRSAKEALGKLHDISAHYEIPLNALCLCFVLSDLSIDKVVIGVDSMKHLKENLDSLEHYDKTRDIREELRLLKFHDEKVILPCNWN